MRITGGAQLESDLEVAWVPAAYRPRHACDLVNRPLVILGAVGNCLDILDAVLAGAGDGTFEMLGFLDDDRRLWNTRIRDYPVLGGLSMAGDLEHVIFVNGIGSPRSHGARATMLQRLGIVPERYATVVHPNAVVSPSAVLGAGSVVLANSTICAGVTVGRHVTLLPGCVVGHDTHIGDCSILAAGAMVSGAVTIGPSCYLGVGCCVRERVDIGGGTLLGAGAVLVEDAPPAAVLVGNPARILRRQPA